MAKWINPAFKKQKIQEDKENKNIPDKGIKTSLYPLKKSIEFFQKLCDTKASVRIVFYDKTDITGRMKWFDTLSICLDCDNKEMIFENRNIMYYRTA
jgi:hypothetical protein